MLADMLQEMLSAARGESPKIAPEPPERRNAAKSSNRKIQFQQCVPTEKARGSNGSNRSNATFQVGSKTAAGSCVASEPGSEPRTTAPLETVQPASEALSASLPSAPVAASLEERWASVALLRDAMAAENERRRNWWREPVEGWREGRLVIRSALTGEATIIELPKGSVSR